MAQHKWAKEIKAWADGAEIEWKSSHLGNEWIEVGDGNPMWHRLDIEFRIKSEPKEPQYLYVISHPQNGSLMLSEYPDNGKFYVGKIKLEVND